MIGNIYPANAWEQDKIGCFSASRIDDLLTEPRTVEARKNGELSQTAKDYILEKSAELTTGTFRDMDNAALEWGRTQEPNCADEVKKHHPDLIYYGTDNPRFFPYSVFSGASPDGISKDGTMVFEFKCPENPLNHIRYCLMDSASDLKKIERGYYHQIQFGMMCVAKAFHIPFMDIRAVFASYCPLVMDGFTKLKLLDIYPDIDFLDRIPGILLKAEKMLAEVVDKLTVNPNVITASYDKEVNALMIEGDEINLSKLKKL